MAADKPVSRETDHEDEYDDTKGPYDRLGNTVEPTDHE